MERLPQIPGYQVEYRLGEGGMAKVYFGLQKKLNRKVAIKVMESFLLKDENFSRRFLKEAETAANLNHPNIVTIYDVGQVGEDYYMVMEYLEGTLKDRIQRMKDQKRALKPSDAVMIMKSIAAALAYAHENGYIHRDIKPDNIMFRNGETPVLVDFGIAKAIGATTKLTKTGMSIGTPHYMSPEQIRGLELDGRADLYSLGVLFYEMLTGEVPYKATDYIAVVMKHLNEPVPELPGALARFQPLLKQLMAKDREMRLAGGRDLIHRLNHPESLPEPPGMPEVPVEPTIVSPLVRKESIHSMDFSAGKNGKKPGRKSRRVAMLVVLLAVAVTALLAVLKPWEKSATESGTVPIASNQRSMPDPFADSVKESEDPAPLAMNTEDSEAKETVKRTPVSNQPEAGEGNPTVNPADKIVASKENSVKGEDGSEAGVTSPPINRDTPPVEKEMTVVRKPPQQTAQKQSDPPVTAKKQPPAVQPLVREDHTPKISPPPVVKMIQVPRDMVRAYIGRMDRLVVNLLPRGVKVMGTLTAVLTIQADGQVRVVKSLDTGVKVIPALRANMVRRLMANRLNSIRLTPPRDKAGKPVRVEDWRLSYRVGTYEGRIILKRRF